MNRTDIINFLIKKFDYKTYLEIGVSNTNLNFNHIEIPYKVGVDPDKSVYGIQHNLTSDEFFTLNNQKFDIIFIDGMHEFHQVYRDTQNSLNILNDGGIIVLHDCNPKNEVIQMVPDTTDGKWTEYEWKTFVEMRNKLTDDGNWSGDCWKSIVKFRTETSEYNTFVIDTDFGVGFIKKSDKRLKPLVINTKLDYNSLVDNRKEWLNLISVDEFINIL